MKGHIGSFLLGVGAAVAGAYAWDEYQRRGGMSAEEIADHVKDSANDLMDRAADSEVVQHARDMAGQVAERAGRVRDNVVELMPVGMVDINEASREDLEHLGISDRDLMDRVVEGRPYRNKLDLLARMIVPQEVYDMIKDHIDIARPDEDVK